MTIGAGDHESDRPPRRIVQPQPLRVVPQRCGVGPAGFREPQRQHGEQRAGRRRTRAGLGRSDSDRALRTRLHVGLVPTFSVARSDRRHQQLRYGVCLEVMNESPQGPPEILHRTRMSRYRTPQPNSAPVRDRAQKELASLYRLALDMGAAPGRQGAVGGRSRGARRRHQVRYRSRVVAAQGRPEARRRRS